MGLFREVKNIEEQVLNRVAVEAKLEAAKSQGKRFVLIKSGSDFQVIECSSKLTELFVRAFEFFNPFVSLIGVEKEYKKNSIKDLSHLVKTMAGQKEAYGKIFQENDPKKVAELLVNHYKNKKRIESSSSYKELQVQMEAGAILVPGSHGARLYQSYRQLNHFVDEVVKAKVVEAHKKTCFQNFSLEAAANMSVFTLFLPLTLARGGGEDLEFYTYNLQQTATILEEISKRLTQLDLSKEKTPSEIEAIHNLVVFEQSIAGWLRVFEGLKGKGLFSEEAEVNQKAEKVVEQLNQVGRTLRERFEGAGRAQSDIHIVEETVIPQMGLNRESLQAKRDEFKQSEDQLHQLYSAKEADYLERQRQLALPKDLIREFEIELFQLPADLGAFVEGVFLGVKAPADNLRLLGTMNNLALEDAEAFLKRFPGQVEPLLEELESALSELKLKDHYQSLLEESVQVEGELKALNVPELKREQDLIFQALVQNLKPFVEEARLREDYLMHLTQEEFIQLRSVLMNQVEQSKGSWSNWIFAGKTEQQAQAELKSYMENYNTILDLLEKKGPLVERVAKLVELRGESLGLKDQAEALKNQMEWFVAHPEEQAKRDRLIKALEELEKALFVFKNNQTSPGVTLEEVREAEEAYKRVLSDRKKLESELARQVRSLENIRQTLGAFKRIMRLS